MYEKRKSGKISVQIFCMFVKFKFSLDTVHTQCNVLCYKFIFTFSFTHENLCYTTIVWEKSALNSFRSCVALKHTVSSEKVSTMPTKMKNNPKKFQK